MGKGSSKQVLASGMGVWGMGLWKHQSSNKLKSRSAHCSFGDALIQFSQDHLNGEAPAPHYVSYLLAALNHQSALRY